MILKKHKFQRINNSVKVKLLVFAFIIIIINCLYYIFLLNGIFKKRGLRTKYGLSSYQRLHNETETYLINTVGCKIRNYNPFDPSVSMLVERWKSPLPDCQEESFLTAKEDKVYLNVEVIEKQFGKQTIKCEYQPIVRLINNSNRFNDHNVTTKNSRPLKFNESLTDEFIKVTCFNNHTSKLLFEDYLALVFLKPEVEKRCEEANKNYLSSDALNIIIIAIDSTSKLNYLRKFPVTDDYLRRILKPFEFHGHTKVADHTFVNIVPMLTGRFVDYYRKEEDIQYTYYDDLEFIWKEFATIGYRTHFIEDTPEAGTFSYCKQGFKYPVTDYYLRPFTIMAEETGEKWKTKKGAYCFGHTSEPEFFYDYFEKFVRTMGKSPFFAFTFISSITHSELNGAGYGDIPTYEILKKLVDSNILNNSALIFFSDHGLRFGDILKTYIGKVEERMPFMFQYYPEWFLKKHEDFRAALTINQRRLTTPFDVHKTLQHLVALSSKKGAIDFRQENPGYGQSLFTIISPNRSCDDAHINPHWCMCFGHAQYDKNDKNIINAANALVNFVNARLNSIDHKSMCKVLYLMDIKHAYVSFHPELKIGNKIHKNIKYFLITLQTMPSKALFEGTVRMLDKEFVVMNEISRIDQYGNQSWCISNPFLKIYCFC